MLIHLFSFLKIYFAQKDGATAIEYGLIAAGISLAIAGAVILLGDTLVTFFYDDLSTALDSAN